MTTTYPGVTLAPTDTARTNWGLRISTLSIPALAIPSALGINRFLSDGQDWTTGGVIAAAGFEGLNIGLSILDIKRPDLRDTASRVRFWSVVTAITMNVLEHYRVRTGGYATFDLMALILALVASVPIAVLYVSMAGLIHGVKEHAATELDAATRLHTELEQARTEALPDVSLGLSYTHSEFLVSGDNPNSLGLQLSLPLPLFDRNQANIGRAALDRRRTDNESTRLEIEIRHQVADAVRRTRRSAALLDVFEGGGMLERADTALKVAERSYKSGAVSLLELLEAQRTYIETREQYLRAQHEYRQAVIDVMHAVAGDVPGVAR